MEALNPDYQAKLDEIAKAIPESEEHIKYLEEEEEEDYQKMRDRFEPMIQAIYEEVAQDNPLQLPALETALLSDDFEGMYLPRILGYTVLRGLVNENYKYTLPQDHFKSVLMAICNSNNFEYLKMRIGQTIQIGFSLSSDIWVTNLINAAVIKQVRYFLQSQKLSKYRDLRERRVGYLRYYNQFKSEEFKAADFPTNTSELKVLYPSLSSFMKHRIEKKCNNVSLNGKIMTFLQHPDFQGTQEQVDMLGLFAGFFEISDANVKIVKDIINSQRKESPEFVDRWLEFILETHAGSLSMEAAADTKISTFIDKSIEDDLSVHYTLMDTIHSKGYIHNDSVEAVKVSYSNHAGMSPVNECTRKTILYYIGHVLNNLREDEYTEYFELSKIFPVYMDIFSNQYFNQGLKELCMKYIKRLLKRYIDKRGRDYQDIKKFVVRSFVDLNFMKKKELVEFFKTKRKKKPVAK